jgi:diguanylate cyclase (GGDEF)-like protein/PAS domain S-box-containing protein
MGLGLELAARHADGTELPVDIALTPLTVDGQRWAAATIRDMRGRAGTPETLRVQATALRSAANGIVITDRRGVIIWVNPAACSITGYAADELVGSHTRLLKSGRHDPGFYEELWKTVNRGESWSGTILNRRRDGTIYHEEQTIAPVVSDVGAVTHFIAIKQDISARRLAEQQLAEAHESLAAHAAEIESLNRRLREQAIRDPLTNLYNRRYLEEAIGRDVARVVRTGEPLAIAAFDLDHFKNVNDLHGHAFGDLVLKTFAQVLRQHARATDLVCRIGGEEFLVVLPGASLAVALERAERYRAGFAAAITSNEAGASMRHTVSIGIAVPVWTVKTSPAPRPRRRGALRGETTKPVVSPSPPGLLRRGLAPARQETWSRDCAADASRRSEVCGSYRRGSR